MSFSWFNSTSTPKLYWIHLCSCILDHTTESSSHEETSQLHYHQQSSSFISSPSCCQKTIKMDSEELSGGIKNCIWVTLRLGRNNIVENRVKTRIFESAIEASMACIVPVYPEKGTPCLPQHISIISPSHIVQSRNLRHYQQRWQS